MGTMKKSAGRFGLCTSVALLLLSEAGCGNSNSDGAGGSSSAGSSGSAGSVASSSSKGGSSSATGGSSSSGGSSSVTSRSTASGGSVASGGSSNPGGSSSTGGSSATAGSTASASGGSVQGGSRTSSSGTGGNPTGGTSAGGSSVTGGAGGASDGGVASDGGPAKDGGGLAKDGGSGTNDDGGTGQACASPLPPITDYTVLAGPFPTTVENNTGPNKKSVIYRPKTLGENGFLHAPIVFGPGIGMQATQLSGLLTSFASHGYVVVGTEVLNGKPNDPGNLKTMRDTLNWIVQQNDAAGSYQGKLATKCAVSMGYSVGGTAAVELGGDAPIFTTVSIHGHTATSAMHGPLLQTSGDKDTVGRPMQQETFDSSKVQTFFSTVSGADHGYIQSNNGGVERVAIIAWMRYWINGDTGAKKYFWGDTCLACVSPWMDPKRKNWQ